jgi:hypothetical protein
VLDYVVFLSHAFKITRRALRFLDFGDLLRNMIKNHPRITPVSIMVTPPKGKSNQPKGYNPVPGYNNKIVFLISDTKTLKNRDPQTFNFM